MRCQICIVPIREKSSFYVRKHCYTSRVFQVFVFVFFSFKSVFWNQFSICEIYGNKIQARQIMKPSQAWLNFGKFLNKQNENVILISTCHQQEAIGPKSSPNFTPTVDCQRVLKWDQMTGEIQSSPIGCFACNYGNLAPYFDTFQLLPHLADGIKCFKESSSNLHSLVIVNWVKWTKMTGQMQRSSPIGCFECNYGNPASYFDTSILFPHLADGIKCFKEIRNAFTVDISCRIKWPKLLLLLLLNHKEDYQFCCIFFCCDLFIWDD